MYEAVAEKAGVKTKEPHEVFFETFIANQESPSCENAKEAGKFCKENKFDVFPYLHGLIHSTWQEHHEQAALIMHHTGISAPILGSKTNNKNVQGISDIIKDHLGPHQSIDPLRFQEFKAASGH